MLQHFHWGSVFLLAVPVMGLLLMVGPILLPESRDPKARRLDFGSAALSLAAVLSVDLRAEAERAGGLGVGCRSCRSAPGSASALSSCAGSAGSTIR